MLVSFAIVAYNEASTLSKALDDLKKQDYPHEHIEVLLVDSMSKDDTYAIMKRFAEEENDFFAVKLFKNPKKVLPAGCNIVLENYSGDALVRVDAHASFPSDFITKNVNILNSGEFVCGGRRPNIIDEPTLWKETLLSAEQSMFGSSIADYRNSNAKKYTSSLFCGMYRREVYDRVGKYNESLFRTEDNDMSYRIRKAGYKLCFSPDIISYQHTRNTLLKMLRQKFLNGFWIGRTLGVSPKCFSLFHFVPFAFVLGIFITTAFCFVGFPWLALIMWIMYGALILGVSLFETVKKFKITNLILPIIFFLLHISYGIGTLMGVVSMPFWLIKLGGKNKNV